MFRGLGVRVVRSIQGLGVWGVFGVSSRLVGLRFGGVGVLGVSARLVGLGFHSRTRTQTKAFFSPEPKTAQRLRSGV